MEEYVFTPDISVIEVECEYDGKMNEYHLFGFNREKENGWSDPDLLSGEDAFYHSLNFEGQYVKYEKEKGQYIFTVRTPDNKDKFKYRQIKLIITVK